MSAAYEASNIFARILAGEIPCHKVYEDGDALVFMDIMPQSEGHTLVVPKAPSRNLLDADPVVLARVMPLVQKVARAAITAFGADGCRIAQFNEPAAGQTVLHLHFHVIPVRAGTPVLPHAGKMADHAVLAAEAGRLRDAMAAL